MMGRFATFNSSKSAKAALQASLFNARKNRARRLGSTVLPSVLSLLSTPLEIWNDLSGTVITDFSSGHGFNTNGGGSHDYNSTTDPIIGSQHFEITTDGTQGYKYCQKIGMTTVDFTDSNLAILMKIDSIDDLDEFQIFLGNSDLSSYRKYSNLEGSQSMKWFDDQWCLFTLCLDSGYTVTGTPDISDIQSIRIAIRDNAVTAVNVKFQGISIFDQYVSPPISIIFGDVRSCVYNRAFSILGSHPGSVGVMYDQIGQTGYMTESQLKELQTAGWEIVAHHPGNDQTAETANNARAYLAASRLFWPANGYKNVTGWVYAGGEFGTMSDETISLLQLVKDAGFSWARTINESGFETAPIADPFRIRTIYVTNTDSATSVNTAIDNCIDSGGWPLLVFHQIVASGASQTTEYNEADLQTIVDHINTEGYTVVKPSTAIQAFNGV